MRTSPDGVSSSGYPRPGTPESIETTDPADAAAFGEFLRKARERSRLTLEQIASDTKIASRYLDALEQGNVEALPGGMYRRAMLRAYADAIGLDKEAALERFERTFEARARGNTPPAAAPAIGAAGSRGRPGGTRVLLVVAGLAAIAILGLVTGNANREEAVPSAPGGPSLPATSADPVDALLPGAADPGPAAASTSSAPPPPSAGSADIDPNDALASAGGGEADRGVRPQPLRAEGRLMIVTEPAGARITINGTGWGAAPVTVPHLPFGSKRVRVTLDGYVSQERVVDLSPERPSATLNVTLAPRD